MKTKFFVKIFSGYLLLMVILLITNLFFTINTSKKLQTDIIFENIKNVIVSVKIAAKNFSNNEEKLQKLINEIDKKTSIRITIIGFSGNVILDSKKDPSSMENHSDRPEFRQAIEFGYAKSIRWSPTLETYMVYYAEKSSNFIIRGSLYESNLPLNSIVNFNNFYRITLILFLTGFLISLFLSHLVYSPIKEILKITEKMKSGNDIVRPIVRIKDEPGRIIENIVEIGTKTLSIKKTEETVRDELYEFINTVDFPVAIIKINGDITICNKHFNETIEIAKKQGLWWEKIKNFELNRILKATVEKKEKLEKELNIKEKYFLCKSIPLAESNEILLLMLDITAIKNIEAKRKEFLTAISHELKTPLTAIKGYIETLKEETTETEKQKYIHIIFHNAERMSRILEDIITLSRLENPNIEIETQMVDLAKIAKNVLLLYENKASQKGLAINLKTQDIPLIKGDAFRLEQMLINLVDNAIRHTEKGKIDISIEYEEDVKNIKIEIADTGTGIEKEHLPHIFEKFYVVDRSRSRNTGGTGLGLSIVKNIVLLHNGKIDVKSTPGEGTKFRITLPA